MMSQPPAGADAAQRMARAAGILVALVGAGHLLAWLSGFMASGIGVTTITMKANASFCLLVAGLVLAALARANPSVSIRFAARVGASTVLTIGALTLVQHIAGVDLGIDQLVATEPAGAAGVLSPNRMGPPASFAFTMIGAALLLLSRSHPARRFPPSHEALATIAVVTALVPIVGYMYGVDQLYGIARYTGIAWPTAAAFLVLAMGVLVARPGEGLVALLLTTDDPGAALIRRLLGPMVLLPLGLGWLRLTGEHRGWFDAGTGTSLLMLIFIVAFTALLVAGGRRVSRLEAAQRANERETRRQLAEIQAIYDSAHVGLCVFDGQLRYLLVNQRLAALNGLPADRHVGRTVDEIVPSLAQIAREVAERVFRTGEGVTDVELSGATVSQPGVVRTFLEQWLPLKDASGRVLAINVVVEEITERKRTEEALRQSGSRLAAAVAIAELGVWEYDVATGLTHFDERCREVFGLADGRAVPSEQIFGLVHADDRLRVQREVAAALDPRDKGVYETEYRIARRDGTERWIAVRGHAVRSSDDASAPASRFVGTLMDITARRRDEEALREANARLAETDRRKDEFIAILSHELRNPLAPIRYALPLLDGGGSGGHSAARAVEVINRQVAHLTRLVDDLLDVSRINCGTIALHRRDVPLQSMLAAAAEAASPVMAAGDHALAFHVADEDIWLHVDAERIVQALTNLLNNSAKYTPPGGQIALLAERHGIEAVIRVRDNGMGIAPETLPALFQMFRRASGGNGAPGGLGIGLALAKRLVEMHGGSIEARSEGIGQGAEFVVRLPVVSPPPVGRAATSGSAPVPRRTLKVLIADDNADLVDMLATVVEFAGHEVRTAADGAKAIQLAMSFGPDVVFLDLGMPVMGGLEVARALRQNPLTAGARLVALTGWGQAADREQTERAGFDFHLTKPTDPERLQELLVRFANEPAPDTIEAASKPSLS